MKRDLSTWMKEVNLESFFCLVLMISRANGWLLQKVPTACLIFSSSSPLNCNHPSARQDRAETLISHSVDVGRGSCYGNVLYLTITMSHGSQKGAGLKNSERRRLKLKWRLDQCSDPQGTVYPTYTHWDISDKAASWYVAMFNVSHMISRSRCQTDLGHWLSQPFTVKRGFH